MQIPTQEVAKLASAAEPRLQVPMPLQEASLEVLRTGKPDTMTMPCLCLQ